MYGYLEVDKPGGLTVDVPPADHTGWISFLEGERGDSDEGAVTRLLETHLGLARQRYEMTCVKYVAATILGVGYADSRIAKESDSYASIGAMKLTRNWLEAEKEYFRLLRATGRSEHPEL